MECLDAAWARGTRLLAAAGIDSARLDAGLLLAAAIGATRDRLLGMADRRLSAAQSRHYQQLLGRREAREPVSHLLGEREFYGRSFRVSAAVLDPRPDSESLIEAALAGLAERGASPRLLDLGCGSGCLLLTLLAERPRAVGIGVDASPAALTIARDNARRLEVAGRASFLVGDWATALHGTFDLVITNPPYIPAAELAGLAPEVARYEPRLALDGGKDGLAAYRRLVPDLPRLLAPGGGAVLECGLGQAAAVVRLAEERGLHRLGVFPDLAGRPRALAFSRS